MQENDNEQGWEFGSTYPVRFLNAKAVDEDRNEIEIPKCEKCGNYKSQVVSKKSLAWICTCCI